MVGALFYSYIFNPLKALQLYGAKKPHWEALASLSLLSVAGIVQAQPFSVTEAMLSAGFNTKSNFNREFLRTTGQAPSDWARTTTLAR